MFAIILFAILRYGFVQKKESKATKGSKSKVSIYFSYMFLGLYFYVQWCVLYFYHQGFYLFCFDVAF